MAADPTNKAVDIISQTIKNYQAWVE